MRTAKETWEATKGALQVQVSKANFDTWIKDTVGLSQQGNQFVVGTPSAFAKEWLEKRLRSLITKVLISITGENVEIQFQVCVSPEPHSMSRDSTISRLLQPMLVQELLVGKDLLRHPIRHDQAFIHHNRARK